MPHRRASVDQVVIASPDTAPFDDAGCGEVCDDPLGCALGDPDCLGDVPEPELPARDWVRVLPTLSGICGSDLAAIGGHASEFCCWFSPSCVARW